MRGRFRAKETNTGGWLRWEKAEGIRGDEV